MLEAKRATASDDIFLELEAYPALAPSTSCMLAYCIRMHKERFSAETSFQSLSPHLLVRMDLRPFKVDLSLNLGPAGLYAMDASFRRSNLSS